MSAQKITIEEINNGVAHWKPLILSALKNYPMTVNNLMLNLLAGCIEFKTINVDLHARFITIALDQLCRDKKLSVERVSANSYSPFLPDVFLVAVE